MNYPKNCYTFSTIGAMLFLIGQHAALAVCPNEPACPPRLDFTVNTWQFMPPSPDPAGIAFIPDPTGSGNDHLLISDSEVEEIRNGITYYQGYNLYETDLDGNLLATYSTAATDAYPNAYAFTNEPTETAINPADGNLFVSDDDLHMIFEVNPNPVSNGGDGVLHTSDDIITSFSTAAFGGFDPEGVAFDPGILADPADDVLYICDGVNMEIYKVMRGPNGVFDGIAPAGDDIVTHFDTESLGVLDPEGIEVDADNRLFIVGKPHTQLAQVYNTGALIRTLDISAANPRKPAGLAAEQGGLVTTVKRIYISDRRIDNDSDPTENDGQFYAFTLPPLKNNATDNLPPSVSAGIDQYIFYTSAALTSTTLQGIVVDDHLPNPPDALTYIWSKLSGPGTVDFTNPHAVTTPATFSAVGTYVLTLEANDGSDSNSDTVQVVVYPELTASTATVYLSTTGSGSVTPRCNSANSLSFKDEDIVSYDPVQDCWSMYFDGSDVNLGSNDIDALEILNNGNILLSLTAAMSLPIYDPETDSTSNTLVDDSDILLFTPTSIGSTTAGSFQMYFDGSDVGLDTDAEDVDSIGHTPDNKLLISTTGNASVPGLGSVRDEDLIACMPSGLGTDTSCTWEMYFDGSDVGLHDGGNAEDLFGNMVDPVNGHIYLTTHGNFFVPGVVGDGTDIFICIPVQTGPNTACNYSPFFDGSAHALNDLNKEVIDGFTVR
ncbi:MAG: PKD domain-containing protein [Gammaproteobacteria bacterium]